MPARRLIPGLLIAMFALPASAQAPQSPRPLTIVPPCAPPPAFPAWGKNHAGPAPLWLGTDPIQELLLGDTAYLSLAPAAGVPLAVPLGKPAQPGDRIGLVTFRADIAATYRIALGGHAWIDVARDGKVVPSIAHAPGTACSGIVKMVDFALTPGRYTIQLSATADPTIRIAVAKLP